VSTTPLLLRLLVVARFGRLFELRFVVARLFDDRAVVFAAGLRAAGFFAAVERFVLLFCGAFDAIRVLLPTSPTPCRSAYPIGLRKTQCARSCTMTTTPSLQALLDAFNAHDVDAVMSFFTEDCIFDMPRGPAPGGRRLVGTEEVRAGIQSRFDGIPDIHYGDDRHWSCGDRGVSEWTIRGTQATGEPIEVRGCDLFEFTGEKISRKDSFWKIID